MSGRAKDRGTVLVVEADPDERERFGLWLEEAGFTVLSCPGPTEPDYTCVGARSGACPLAKDSDVVVLDMSLDSEAVMMGTAAEELLGLYLLAGRPVVVLGAYRTENAPHEVTRLPRHPESPELVAAVKAMLVNEGPGALP